MLKNTAPPAGKLTSASLVSTGAVVVVVAVAVAPVLVVVACAGKLTLAIIGVSHAVGATNPICFNVFLLLFFI
ncbi:MAG: hypothetical protein ACI9FR_002747 [Cryomorphaceae bacterium]